MKQIIPAETASLSVGDFYYHFGTPGKSTGSTDQTIRRVPWAVAGTFRTWKIQLSAAPGAGTSRTFTVYLNDVATAMSITIADTATEGSYTVTELTAAPGDFFTFRSTQSGSPATASARTAVEFESTSTTVSVNAVGGSSVVLATSSTRRMGLLASDGWSSDTGANVQSVYPTAGTIEAFYVQLSGAPGTAPDAYAFHIYKNGVKQDGAGGTVDTTVTITGTATSGSATFSLSVAAGDTFYVEDTPTSTPTGRAGSFSTKFSASVAGESVIAGWSGTNGLSATATREHNVHDGNTNWDISASALCVGHLTSFLLRDFYLVKSAAPGTGNSWTFTLRKNGATPTDPVEIVLSHPATTGSDTIHETTITAADTFVLRSVPAGGTGVASTLAWAMVQFISVVVPKVGCFVAGVTTTVKATRAAAFGLDGATNVHDEAGKLKVFGNFEVTGLTTLTGGLSYVVGSQAPGSFTIATEQFGLHGKRLMLTTTQRLTVQGTGRLVISG